MVDDDLVGISFDETSTEADLQAIAALFGADVPAKLHGICRASRGDSRASCRSRFSTRTAPRRR